MPLGAWCAADDCDSGFDVGCGGEICVCEGHCAEGGCYVVGEKVVRGMDVCVGGGEGDGDVAEIEGGEKGEGDRGEGIFYEGAGGRGVGGREKKIGGRGRRWEHECLDSHVFGGG